MLRVADRVAAPSGGIYAGTASWTIGAEEDGPRVRMSMPHCRLISGEVRALPGARVNRKVVSAGHKAFGRPRMARSGRGSCLTFWMVAAILVWPACRMSPITRLRKVTMMRGLMAPTTPPAAGYRRPRRLVDVSEPVPDDPADSAAVTAAVANARRGVITHLTISGERVAAIVPESVIEALRTAEDAEDIAEADAAWDEPGESIPLDDLEAEFGH